MEWKELKEIFDTRNGYTPSTSNETFWEGGTIPWFKMEDIRDNGSILNDSYLHITDKAIKGKGLFKANSLLLATSATIGEHALIEVEHLSNQRFTNFYPKKGYENRINMRYAYYYMYIIDEWCKQHINQGGFASVDMGGLYKLPFPIPSLSEQQQIVEQLDAFTSSIENLKEQIAQRRKQYEYYRDQLYYPNKGALLKASEDGKVEVKTLDEIGTFTRGRRFVRTDIVPEGVPCIHYGDMYTYYGISADTTPTHLTKEIAAKLRFAKKGDVVIVAAGENDIDIGVGVAWLGNEDVVVHDACFIYKHDMNPKYISHYLRSGNYHQQIRMGVVDGKICSISAKELGRTLIPVPPLSKQQRIVSILDTFEASIRNLEQQLAQREKQYEYYRNKLLTFE